MLHKGFFGLPRHFPLSLYDSVNYIWWQTIKKRFKKSTSRSRVRRACVSESGFFFFFFWHPLLQKSSTLFCTEAGQHEKKRTIQDITEKTS